MSVYGDKYNFYDSISGKDIEQLKKMQLLITPPYGIGPNYKVEIKEEKDLIYWYDHGIAMSYGNKNGEAVYILSRYPMHMRERERYGVLSYTYHFKKNMNEELEKNGLPLKYTKEECSRDFWTNTSFAGNLYKPNLFDNQSRYDKVFIRFDKDKNIYLVYEYKYKNEQFLIVKIDKDIINKMLVNDIKIVDIFKSNDDTYLTTYDIDRDWLFGKKKKGSTRSQKIYKKIPEYYNVDKLKMELEFIQDYAFLT